MRYFTVVLLTILVINTLFYLPVFASPTLIPYFDDLKTLKYFLDEGNYRYAIPYEISNATLKSMTISCDDPSLQAELVPIGTGQITLHIPRSLIDAKLAHGEDDVFLVMSVDEKTSYKEEIPYTEKHQPKNLALLKSPLMRNLEKSSSMEQIGLNLHQTHVKAYTSHHILLCFLH